MRQRKVRTGCRTCRARRVKCSEERPTCDRCLRSGFACEGYGIVLAGAQSVAPDRHIYGAVNGYNTAARALTRRPSAFVDLDSSDAVAFDFVRRETLAQVCASHYSRFWTSTVLCKAHTDPTVLQALLALSAAHQHRYEQIMMPESYNRSGIVLSVKHYYKSVTLLRHRLEDAKLVDKAMVLTVSLILLCCDIMLGRYGHAFIHLRSGRSILQQHLQTFGGVSRLQPVSLKATPETSIDELSSEFALIDLQSANFGSWVPVFTLNDGGDSSTIPDRFTSLDDALRYLSILHNHGHHLNTPEFVPGKSVFHRMPWTAEASQRQGLLLASLGRWKTTFDNSALRPLSACVSNSNVTREKYLRSRLGYEYLFLVISTAHVEQELDLDHLTTTCSHLVDLCEELQPMLPKISITSAIVQPLFVIGCNCRHPVVRRRCINILSKAGVEGYWDAELVKVLTEVKMQVEEEEAGYQHVDNSDLSLSAELSTKLIPLHARYAHTLAFFIDQDYKLLEIELRRPTSPPQGMNSTYYSRKTLVNWPPPH